MIAVLLTLHVLIVLALIGVVLLQRSEGGALGIGGGGGGGGFLTGRGAANALTRTTSILAALFFATSMALAIAAGRGDQESAVFEELTGGGAAGVGETPSAPGAASTDDLLKSLGAEEGGAPAPNSGGDATAPTGDVESATPESAPDGAQTAPQPAPVPETAPAESEEPPAAPEEPNS